MQALQEYMFRGMNLIIRDESDGEREEEQEEEVLNLEEERLFKAITKILEKT